jgi:ProP effector
LSDPNTTPEPASASTPSPKVNPNKAAFLELAAAFPELFNLQAAVPLAIGIHTQLAASNNLSKTKIRRGLGFYVRQRAYLKALAAGGPRQGLAGPSGEVTSEEAEHAKQQLAELEKVLQERRAKFRAEQNQKSKAKQPPKAQGKPQAKTKPVKVKSNSEPAAVADPETRLSHKLNQLSERFGKSKND